MYQNFKTNETAANCSGAMESGNHFKNGASSKSQMSRKNKSMSVKEADVK